MRFDVRSGADASTSDWAATVSKDTGARMIDSKELLRRFKAGGWPGPTQVHALLAETAPPTRDDIERMLAVLTSKGLPGDSRDQSNRLFIFRTQAEKVIDKALFLPYVRALRGGDG